MKKFLVVGGGTAGVIASTYLKQYYGPRCEVTLLYDHKNPRLGVGESTTPYIFTYLDYLNISLEKLLRDTNFTIKLGVKFKNWLGKNDIYWNNFSEIDFWNRIEDKHNLLYAYERYSGCEKLNHYQFNSFFTENNLIPNTNKFVKALNIDTEEFSNYILKNCAEGINIIDDIVKEVKINEDGIDYILTEKNKKLTADIYFDASGFNRLLISKLSDDFIDLGDQIVLNRALPFQIKKTKKYIPSYALSEATENGWIWETPLYNRYGSGYLYSSKFTSDDEAKNKFNQWLIKNHGVELESDFIIKYNPGHYKNAWVKNCIALGFASGFLDPLEATAIQLLIDEVFNFVNIYSGKILNYDINIYNEKYNDHIKSIIKYITIHYHTRRTDSEFWQYMTSNMPEWVHNIEEKVKNSILTEYNTKDPKFSYNEYSAILDGLNLSTQKGCQNYLFDTNLIYNSKDYFEYFKNIKKENQKYFIDHKEYLIKLKK